MGGRDMTTQCIMQIPDEIVAVVLIERHEGSAHDDELYLVHVVSYLLQLLHSVSGLDVGVITRSDGPH